MKRLPIGSTLCRFSDRVPQSLGQCFEARLIQVPGGGLKMSEDPLGMEGG